MTCIAGTETIDGDVVLGADSFWGEASWYQKVDTKVFRVTEPYQGNDMLFAHSGHPRLKQLVKSDLQLPPHYQRESDRKYLTVDFTERLRKLLREHGALSSKDTDEPISRLLIGYRGRLYYLSSTFQITRTTDGYATGGAGYQYALGVLAALDGTAVDAVERVERAIKAAATHSPSVALPGYIESLGYPDFRHEFQ